MQSINNLARGAYQSLTATAGSSTVNSYVLRPLIYFRWPEQANQPLERYVLVNAALRQRLLDDQDITDLRLDQLSRTSAGSLTEKASPRFWRPLSWNGLGMHEVDSDSSGFTRVTNTQITPAKLARMGKLTRVEGKIYVLDTHNGQVHCLKGSLVRVSGVRDARTVVSLQSTV